MDIVREHTPGRKPTLEATIWSSGLRIVDQWFALLCRQSIVLCLAVRQ
jgi:hypothetical protein